LGKELICVEGDIRDLSLVTEVLRDHKIDAVIHFAGLKAVGESVRTPIEYYANNVEGTISLLKAMKSVGVKTLVFSSSATVYGDPQYLPIDEKHPTGAINPYGRTKLHVEEILSDVSQSDSTWRIMCLRYFNPVGAHESGLIGEDPTGKPNNLAPYVSQVAAGMLPMLKVYGTDYSTVDGTGVRDYIHVMDLAEGHVAGLKYIERSNALEIINLGTGIGHSVMQMIDGFQRATGKKITYEVVARRPGDIATCFADSQKAKDLLNWVATRSLDDMCSSSWKWQRQHQELSK
jgi:UDP-glucose 4-epimerase